MACLSPSPRWCARLVADPQSGEQVSVTPGAWRTHEVAVGRHIAISAGAVPRFLARFEAAYHGLGPTDAILAAAYAIIACCGYTHSSTATGGLPA